jgi:tetratricopeptide (TPR) repeat protein
MPPDLKSLIDAGLALERDGREQEAIDYFRELLDQHPDSALIAFEMGGAYDFAGREAEAVPHYRRAIALGLPEELIPRVMLQLGSTLRNLGEVTDAVTLLSDASQKYPNNRGLRVFLALALHSSGQSQRAIVTLLDTLLLDPDELDGYARAIGEYTDLLR